MSISKYSTVLCIRIVDRKGNKEKRKGGENGQWYSRLKEKDEENRMLRREREEDTLAWV